MNDQLIHVLRKRGFKNNRHQTTRVSTGQSPRMQHLSFDLSDEHKGGCRLSPVHLAAGVNRVSEDGMIDGGAMDTGLMGSTGFQIQFDQRQAFEPLAHFPTGFGHARFAAADRHALAVHWVPADRKLNHATVAGHLSEDDGKIDFTNAASGKLTRKMGMRGRVFGDDEYAGGVFVQTVNDARPQLAADGPDGRTVIQQGIDQSAGRVAGGRVNNHPGRLVEDDQVIIFVEYIQGQRLRFHHRVSWRRYTTGDLILRLQPVTGLFRQAIDRNLAVLNQDCRLRARQGGYTRGNQQINTRPRIDGIDNDVKNNGGGHVERKA